MHKNTLAVPGDSNGNGNGHTRPGRSPSRRTHRIVLTGGPGGGKTTGGDILRREFGQRVAFVPEGACCFSCVHARLTREARD